ncbi:hypothetical protein BJY52DRAFT_463144 [Lactarius psammicola]|nr:hypothetical protein BJY52DRAFT_463144 [Lactarius psammicola]
MRTKHAIYVKQKAGNLHPVLLLTRTFTLQGYLLVIYPSIRPLSLCTEVPGTRAWTQPDTPGHGETPRQYGTNLRLPNLRVAPLAQRICLKRMSVVENQSTVLTCVGSPSTRSDDDDDAPEPLGVHRIKGSCPGCSWPIGSFFGLMAASRIAARRVRGALVPQRRPNPTEPHIQKDP